jgi:sugar phosphate isomerase/epimerase
MQNRYNLGLVSVSFRDKTPEEILKAMQRVGLSYIEWGSDVHAPCTDTARLQELAALQTRYGITCCSFGTYFRLGKTPHAELPDYIAAAKTLGTDILRLWCGTKGGAEMTEDERESLLDICRAAAELAAREGVVLCMECHKKTFTERPADAVWLMKQVSSPHFRMYWQPFQWQTVQENRKNAAQIAPFAAHIHVFNWKGEDKLPLGDAVAEWQAYLAHFSTPRTLLLEFMPDGQLESLAAEVSALREITGESK